MRKMIILLAVFISFFLNNAPIFAGWKQLNPQIVGGTLDARNFHGLASIGKGNLILAGGQTNSTVQGADDLWLFSIDKNRWTEMAATMNGRFGFGMAYLGWDSVIIYGGNFNSSYRGDTLSFNGFTNSLTLLSPDEINGSLDDMGDVGMSYIDEGKVLLFGGHNAYGDHNSTYLYNTTANQWELLTTVGVTPAARRQMSMAYIGSSQAIVFGGYNGATYFNDTWIYDLVQNQWTEMTPIVEGGALSARKASGMAYIGGDRVLLFGGTLNASAVRTNEIWMYDLSDNKWTNLTNSGSATMPTARESMGFAFAGLGQVIMHGGYSLSRQADTWRFSVPNNIPETVNWQPQATGVQVSWSVPVDYAGVQFSIYRDGIEIISNVPAGTAVSGMVPYSYLDEGASPGHIHRYQIKEIYPVMNSEIFYPEFGVPFCP